MADTQRYLVAGCTPWARRVFDSTLSKLPGEWVYADNLEHLVAAATVPEWQPAYIFFLHWRWKVPKEIVEKYPCIGFHLGRFPDERGGSPLQWRILSGQSEATLSMFRMTEQVDGGRIIAERDRLPLHGAAEAVYARAMEAAADMIGSFLQAPEIHREWEQEGEPYTYKRRAPEDSRILDVPQFNTLEKVYDEIRCVDAEGYPRAFITYGGLRFEFDRAVLYDGRIKADVTITEVAHD
ncbi:MAG TPA: hypothetical protein VD948_12885 [Rhodothermales bacterium]|nr:hypothetical protein [Rhodothermales bacterium]